MEKSWEEGWKGVREEGRKGRSAAGVVRRRGSASGLRVLGKRRRRRLPIGVAGAGADPIQRPRRINEAVARGAQWR